MIDATHIFDFNTVSLAGIKKKGDKVIIRLYSIESDFGNETHLKFIFREYKIKEIISEILKELEEK